VLGSLSRVRNRVERLAARTALKISDVSTMSEERLAARIEELVVKVAAPSQCESKVESARHAGRYLRSLGRVFSADVRWEGSDARRLDCGAISRGPVRGR